MAGGREHSWRTHLDGQRISKQHISRIPSSTTLRPAACSGQLAVGGYVVEGEPVILEPVSRVLTASGMVLREVLLEGLTVAEQCLAFCLDDRWSKECSPHSRAWVPGRS